MSPDAILNMLYPKFTGVRHKRSSATVLLIYEFLCGIDHTDRSSVLLFLYTLNDNDNSV